MDWLLYLLLALSGVSVLLSLCSLLKHDKNAVSKSDLEALRRDSNEEQRATRTEMTSAVNEALKNYSTAQTAAISQIGNMQDARLRGLDERFKTLGAQTEQQLTNVRTTMEQRIASLQEDNNKRLEQMRVTVDEKLQKTLEDKLTQSFGLVNERLEQVYKGLGEMQTLAAGVGDLKKVLSNVKTRGILGEIQLGAILQEILTPEQYEENVATHKGSSDRVEFAVKLPAGEDGCIYLPIDAKFPADLY
ncbi:MAG: DNA recombination protein RmuC, partial [Pygmaiobacter sp.]